VNPRPDRRRPSPRPPSNPHQPPVQQDWDTRPCAGRQPRRPPLPTHPPPP
jgi:hypothetical protein